MLFSSISGISLCNTSLTALFTKHPSSLSHLCYHQIHNRSNDSQTHNDHRHNHPHLNLSSFSTIDPNQINSQNLAYSYN